MTMRFEEYDAYVQGLLANADKQREEKVIVRVKNVAKKTSALKPKLHTPHKPKRR